MNLKNYLYEQSLQALKKEGIDDKGEAHNVASLALKNILSDKKFKESFSFCRLYQNPEGNLSVGHSMLDCVIKRKRDRNQNLMGVRFNMEDDRGNYLLNGLFDSKKHLPVLSNQELDGLESIRQTISKEQDIGKIVEFFNDNPDKFYTLMSLRVEINPFLDDLREMVSLDFEKGVRCYKLNLKETDERPFYKHHIDALEHKIFQGFNKLAETNDGELWDKILDPNTCSNARFYELMLQNEKGIEHIPVMNVDFDLSQPEKRQKFLSKMMNNEVFYEGALLKPFFETSKEQRKQAVYNQFVLQDRKESFLKTIESYFERPTMEQIIEENNYHSIVNEVVEKTCQDCRSLFQTHKTPETDTEFSGIEGISFKTYDFEKNSGSTAEDVLDEQFFRLYDDGETEVNYHALSDVAFVRFAHTSLNES